LKEQPIDEAHRLVHAADQLGGQTHEGDDLSDRGAVVQVQPGAEREDRDQRDRRARARQHGEQRPPIEHRELRGDQLVHGAAQVAGLRGAPAEALDQRDVAKRVACLLGERRMVAFDPGLRRVGVVEHQPAQHGDGQDQEDEQRPEPPVQEQGERQEDEQRHEGREVLAQERQPHPEQRVGAMPHDLELAARVHRAVERVRQLQHVLEIPAHGSEPAPLRHAVGVERHQDAGADAGPADQAPQHEQEHDLPPGLAGRARVAAGEGVDDSAEQQGAEKAGRREGRVGQDQGDRKLPLRRQQRHDAAVESQDAHRGPRPDLAAERFSLRIGHGPADGLGSHG
jgi:hypothetical protein